MRELLQKHGNRGFFWAGFAILVVMVSSGFLGGGFTNVAPTDIGGGDEPIKYLQGSPPTPTPPGGGCTAGDTGFLDPTSEAFDTGGDGDGFELNPTNAFADAGGNASNINGSVDRHRFYDYGVSIPSECSIWGIEVRLDWWLDAIPATNSLDAELSWDGGASWTATKRDEEETTSEHTGTLGATVDRWGRTWALADFDDANFRVRLTSNGINPRDFFLDWVPVKVHYGDAIETTGLKNPIAEASDTGGDGDGFELNSTNAFADGGGAAEDVFDGTGTTTCGTSRDRHRYYDYGISIPAGSTIHGIEVRLDAWAAPENNSPIMCVELSWDGGTSWTAFRFTPTLVSTEATYILGGGADGWGRTWSNTEFTNANFRVRISNVGEPITGGRNFTLDWVPVEVYYTTP